MNKIKKAFVTAGIAATLIAFMTGCDSNFREKKGDELSTKITHILQDKIAAEEPYELLDFQLMGTDVAKTAFNFGVKFNGVASLSNGDKAFASLNYSIQSTEFLKLEKRSEAKKVYNILDKIVQNYHKE